MTYRPKDGPPRAVFATQEVTEPAPRSLAYKLSTAIRASELEATRGRLFAGVELVLLRCLVYLGSDAVVFLLGAEVVFDDVEHFLVDVEILMVLEELNLVQTYIDKQTSMRDNNNKMKWSWAGHINRLKDD